MANADDLRNLAEEMGKAYEDRVASLSALRKETAKLLNTFQKESKGRHREVSGKLKDFDKAHKEMGAQLKATLAEVKPALEKDEADRVAQTQAEIQARVNEVTRMLADFDKAHKEMGAQLKATLAEVKPALEKDEADRVAQTQAEIQARVNEVTRMLADFDKAHKEMGAQLKATLAEVKPALEKDEADRVAQTQTEIKARVNEVTRMLADFRKDQDATAAAWQNLVKTLGAKRKAKPVVEKVVPKVKEEVEVVEEVAVEEVKEIPAEKPMEEQVLSLIDVNPQGIKLTEMENILGVPRIKLGGITRSLLNAGKIRKEGLLYLPKEEE